MLEIFFLIFFGRKLAEVASGKGRSKAWALLGVGFWIVGEVMGFVVGGLMGLDLGAYLVAIGFAIIGAVVSYTIVNALAAAPGWEDGLDPEI